MRTKTSLVPLCFFIVALLLPAGAAQAMPLVLDYTGFSWNSGQVNMQHFNSVGVIDGFSEPVNDPAEVYTYYLSNLTLASVINHSATRHTYIYSGGQFSLYRSTDPGNRGYDYGVDPENGTVPSTFIDGVTWLDGGLSSFSIYVDDNLRLGSLSAEGSFTSGEFSNMLEGDSYFSFAGLTARPGSGIPQGYNYRLDGQVDAAMSPVPEPASVLLLGAGLLAGGLVGLRRRRS